jgi:hypothetical protein
MLVSKFVVVMDLTTGEDGRTPIPNLLYDKFDTSKVVEIDITQVEMDYILCALHAIGFEGTGYPENINSASSRAYNKIGGQFIDDVVNHTGKDVWGLTDKKRAVRSEL